MAARVLMVTVASNAMAFVPDFLASCRDASTEGLDVLLVDNASDDGVAAAARAAWPTVMILRQPHNLGALGGFNRAVRYALEARTGAQAEHYLLSVSPDTVLTPGCVDRLVAAAEADPTVGSVTGTLLRAFRDPNAEHPAAEAIRSDVIESTGLVLRKNRHVAHRGIGEINRGQFAQDPEVFGAPWSFALFRLSALADAWKADACLDPDLSLPMAELDVAWRLRWCGWTARSIADAHAYRFCGARAAAEQGRGNAVRRRPANETPWRLARDRCEAILKNESVLGLILASPRVLFSAVREPWSLLVVPAIILRLPRIWAKRRALRAVRKASARDARHWPV